MVNSKCKVQSAEWGMEERSVGVVKWLIGQMVKWGAAERIQGSGFRVQGSVKRDREASGVLDG